MPRRDSDSVSSIPRNRDRFMTGDIMAPNSPALVSLTGDLPDLYEENAITYPVPRISADDCENVVEV
jgi:hypothetical protein